MARQFIEKQPNVPINYYPTSPLLRADALGNEVSWLSSIANVHSFSPSYYV